MNTTSNLSKYMIAYAIWGIGVNVVDYYTPWLRKQEGGGWQKSTKPPFYWDNWSWTHIGWGAFAAIMQINTPIFILLNAANELILEQGLCHAANNIEAIKFSANCDPLPHMVADFTYGMIGYVITKKLTQQTQS